MNKIKIVNLKKRFGEGRWISNDLNLDIPTGKTTCIIGQSGEGKSVLLKQVIGLIKPDSGSIFVDDIDIVALTGEARENNFKKFGYVFQFAALLDSLSVYENVGIVDLENGIDPEIVRTKVKEKLSMVNLAEDTIDKYPSELSGGMKKRVGLARTLMGNPEIILYDEPTTGLDPITSCVVHELIADMQKRLGITSVVISHDVEIFKYVDYVALLYQGKIVSVVDAATIWESEDPYINQF
ncbi:ATP-binding cassette domain-containing protein, partial [Candidatus Babeliales bacterium]|nr:ATP-binding cassette domain-containing protein [Candidatus Babeliales bacterium]